MAIEKTSRFVRAVTPRAFEHWNRTIGAGNRIEIQALSLGQHFATRAATARIEQRIEYLQVDQRVLRASASQLRKETKHLKHLLGEALTNMGQFRRLFEDAPVGFHVLGVTGVIYDVNTRWIDLLGYSKEEILGKRIFDFIVPEQRQEAEQRFYARINKQPLPAKTSDRRYLRKDGEIVYVETYDTVVRDEFENPVSVQTSFQDITSRVAAEKLRNLLSEYERMAAVGELSGDISHTYRNQITAMIGLLEQIYSHELEVETNLRVFQTSRNAEDLSIAKEQLVQLRRKIDLARKELSEMEMIVRGILSLSRVGAEAKTAISVIERLTEMEEPMRSHAEKLGVTLEIRFVNLDKEDAILISESGFQDMIRNLVWNAIDACKDNIRRKPRVVIDVFKGARDEIQFSIQDNGVGIEDQRMSEMLEKLRAGKRVGTTKGAKGTGIGLGVVGKVVSSAEGRIGIESQRGSGTRFLISFPSKKILVAFKVPIEAARLLIDEKDAAKLLVMVVDDEPSIRELNKQFLLRTGFRVVELASEKDVFAYFSGDGERPHLMLVDKNIAGANGVEVISKIARMPNPPAFILCTGDPLLLSPTDPLRRQLEERGVEYLQKPFTMARFDEVVFGVAHGILADLKD